MFDVCIFLITSLLLANAATAASPATIHVSPGQSLSAARDQARGRPGSAIILAGGNYVLDEPIILTPADSHVSWQAAAGQSPVFSGGRSITGWHSATLNGHPCWSSSVPGVKEGKWFFRDLWINGRRAIRARSPNNGYFNVAESPDAGPNWEVGQTRFQFSGDDIPAGPFPFGAEAIIGTRWVESRLPLVSVDSQHHLATFSRKSQWRIEPGDPYWLEGDPRWFDQPGEWFLDRAAGAIYYLPRDGEKLETIHAVAPVLNTLLELNGSPKDGKFIEVVTFRGITFSHTHWEMPEPNPATTQPISGGYTQADLDVPAAVHGEGLRRCAFDQCTFQHLGTWGIDLATASLRCRIERCKFSDLGAGGVRIGDPFIHQGADLQSFDNRVADCDIGDGGRGFPSATGVWIGQSFDNRIEYNHIHDLFYSGISAGWTWGYGASLNRGNLIEHNLIDHIGKLRNGEGPLLSDMGGVYLLGARRGTIVRDNVFHDISGVKYGGWGIYLDEGSSNVIIENNLVYRTTHGSFHLHYGADNIVRNNIFADAGEQQIRRSRDEGHLSATFEHNIVCWDGKTPMTKTSPDNVRFDHNLYVIPKPDDFHAGGKTWRKWQTAGEDAHSVLVTDPIFTDPAKGDFHLMPGSPAEKIGFNPFDFLRAGPRRAGIENTNIEHSTSNIEH